jgi:proline iminopeptidase
MKRMLLILIAVVGSSWVGSTGIREGHLDVNGTRLFFKTMGEGDPIVVLHGGPGFDHRQFLPYIWQLATEHQVILYDQRGTGLSSGPVDAASINIDTFVADLDGIRQAFGIDHMNLVGHSWGGILAQYYAIRHPDRLKSLVLCSTTASASAFAEMRANYEVARRPEDAELLGEIYDSEAYKNGDPETVERFWRIYFKPYFADQNLVDKLDLHFEQNTIKNSSAVAGFILKSIGEFDLHQDLRGIRCPTLILHGDSDPMPLAYAEKIRDSIDGSTLVIAENSGHWLFVDATDTFTSSILEFLRSHNGAP